MCHSVQPRRRLWGNNRATMPLSSLRMLSEWISTLIRVRLKILWRSEEVLTSVLKMKIRTLMLVNPISRLLSSISLLEFSWTWSHHLLVSKHPCPSNLTWIASNKTTRTPSWFLLKHLLLFSALSQFKPQNPQSKLRFRPLTSTSQTNSSSNTH